MMAREKIKGMQEPEDILHFMPKYKKYLIAEELPIQSKSEDIKIKRKFLKFFLSCFFLA